MEARNQLESLLLLSDSDPTNNLSNLLPISPPVSLEDFITQCGQLIYGVDPQDHVDPQKRSIPLPKSRLFITPFQLWEAVRMLDQRQRTGLRGGLQASGTGLGKTILVIIVCALRARIFESERQVKHFWETKPSPKKSPSTNAHLPQSARGDNLRCPSQKDSDIVCFCVPTSKARNLVDSGVIPRGISLIQAPLQLIGQYIQIFENAALNTSAYNLCIVHSEVPARLKRDFGAMTRSLAQPPTRDSPAPETCITVSSHGNPTVLEKFANASVNVGVMFSDECHLAMKLESRSMAIAVAQSKVGRGGMDLWLVSATPIRFLIDWELPISLIANSIDLSRAASVMDVVTAHAAAKSSDDNMRRFLALWSKVFDKDLVLRNVVTSQFCGKSITDLQTILPNTVWLKTPDQHHEDVQAVAHQAREVIRTKALAAQEDEAPFQPDYASGIDPRLYFVSLFPGAAALIRNGLLSVDEKNITDSISAIKDSNKLKVEKSAHFPQYLDEIARNSPKLDFVLGEIERMQRDKDVRAADPELPANGHGENLALKKMVIITPTLGTAVFLYLILLKRVPDLAPALLHSRARASDREAVLNSFTSLTARKTAKHSYILITSFSGGGTGLNLQSANYQILMSPLSSRDHEIQAFARTNRTGQRLALHHSRLISVDSAADRINVVSFAGRSIKNDPFEMGRRLVLSESDGFKRVQRLEDWGYQVDDTEIDSLPYMVENLYSAGCEYQACKITFPAESKQSIDELVYFGSNTTARDVLCINEAWNARRDSRARHEKLPLRDILLGLWVFNLNRSAHDLKHLLYFTVIEASLNHTLRPHVYRLLGEDMRNQLVIHRESESPQEAEAFSLLIEEAPFCAGAEKMLREYSEFSDVHIASFDFLPVILEGMDDDEPFFDFRINFE